jgi:hypothetical protein
MWRPFSWIEEVTRADVLQPTPLSASTVCRREGRSGRDVVIFSSEMRFGTAHIHHPVPAVVWIVKLGRLASGLLQW